MQNYNDLKLNEAQFLSVVGVKLQQFNILVQFLNLAGNLIYQSIQSLVITEDE